MASSSFDVVVIGSGSAGFAAVEAARALGASVCMVEKEKLGGECPNWACIPSKALLRAAKAARAGKESEAFGISISGVQVDFKRVMAYRKKAVEAVTGGGENGDRYVALAKSLGAEVHAGEAMFTDPFGIEAGGKRIIGKAFVIATGSTEFIPPIPGLAEIRYLTSRTALTLERQPKAVAIVGGGPVGSELATFFSAIGTRTILLQSASTILNREDPEIAVLAHEALKARGVELVANARITEIIDARGGIYGVRAVSGTDEKMHAVDHVIVATGKRPNIGMLALETANVAVDARGAIATNAEGRTNVRHIFAAGDADGGLMFTHTAHAEGAIAGHNAALAALQKRAPAKRRDLRVVPRVTFVDPEVASVGLTAAEAKAKFKTVLVGRFAIGGLGRAVADSARIGLVKIVAHPKTRRVIGCHIIGNRAGELIHEAALAMHLNATVDKVASMIHAYPTYSEAVAAACANVVVE